MLFDIFMNMQFGFIINFRLEQNVSSCVMSKVIESVFRFRAGFHHDVWESLMALQLNDSEYYTLCKNDITAENGFKFQTLLYDRYTLLSLIFLQREINWTYY